MSYLIVSIVFFILSIALFSGIAFIVFKNKECKIKENKLKKEWNDLSLYDFEKINLPIEHISFLDEKFEKIMFLFNDFAESHKEQLEVIKKRIYKLPKTLENYDWKSFKNIYISTQMEIKMLKSSLVSLFELQQKILSYKDYVSYVLVAYRENSWNLINFYNTNLLDNKIDQEYIIETKNRIQTLRDAAEKLNNCIENFDINTTIIALNNINNAFVKLWEIVNKMYISNKQNNYINYSINEINNILKNNYKSIKTTLINEAEKQISKAIKNRDFIKANTHKMSEQETQKLTLSVIKTLWKVKKDLNITFKSSEFFNKNKPKIDKSFSVVVTTIPDLIKIFKKVYNNFVEDHEIKTLILNCNTQYNKILSLINSYKKEIDKNNYDPSQLLNNSKDIMQMLVDNTVESDKIVSEIISKYNLSKKLLDDITSTKLLLTQMKAFMIENKIDDSKKMEWVEKLFSELDENESKFFAKKSTDWQYCVTSLAETKSEIMILGEVLIKVQLLKDYVEKIVNYACLKMSLDQTINYNFDETLKLYYEGKYKESALSILYQMKK